MDVNRKILKTYLTLLFCLVISTSNLLAQVYWMERYNQQVEENKTLKIKVNDLGSQIQSLNNDLVEAKRNSLSQSKGNENDVTALKRDIELLTKKLDKNTFSVEERDRLNRKISTLENDKRGLIKDKKQLVFDKNKLEIIRSKQAYSLDSVKSLLSEARRQLETNSAELIKLKKEYEKLDAKYNKVKNDYDDLIKCLNTFCNDVEKQLLIANDAYESYKEFKYKDTLQKKTYFNAAWAIYKNIYYDKDTSICSLAKRDCLGKNNEICIKACMNISSILIYNRENAIGKLEGTTNEQLISRTEMILSSLSLMIKSGDNEGRKQAINSLGALPRIVFQEGNSSANGMTLKLIKIKDDYDKGNFNSALSEFDRLYFLLSMDEISQIGEPIVEAKYCAGMILLWELADIKAIDSWAVHGSWLKSNKASGVDATSIANNTTANNSINNVAKGKELLKEALKATKNEPLKKEIRYALSKFPIL